MDLVYFRPNEGNSGSRFLLTLLNSYFDLPPNRLSRPLLSEWDGIMHKTGINIPGTIEPDHCTPAGPSGFQAGQGCVSTSSSASSSCVSRASNNFSKSPRPPQLRHLQAQIARPTDGSLPFDLGPSKKPSFPSTGNPKAHLLQQRATEDPLLIRLFQRSLTYLEWFISLEPGSIKTFAELANRFIHCSF